MANPRHTPTDRNRGKVEALAAYGQKEQQIARALGISEPTLRKYYRRELDVSHDALLAQMAQTLADIALGRGIEPGDKRDRHSQVTALIFWLKTRGSWRQTVDINPDQDNGASALDRLNRDLDRLAAARTAGETAEAA